MTCSLHTIRDRYSGLVHFVQEKDEGRGYVGAVKEYRGWIWPAIVRAFGYATTVTVAGKDLCVSKRQYKNLCQANGQTDVVDPLTLVQEAKHIQNVDKIKLSSTYRSIQEMKMLVAINNKEWKQVEKCIRNGANPNIHYWKIPDNVAVTSFHHIQGAYDHIAATEASAREQLKWNVEFADCDILESSLFKDLPETTRQASPIFKNEVKKQSPLATKHYEWITRGSRLFPGF